MDQSSSLLVRFGFWAFMAAAVASTVVISLTERRHAPPAHVRCPGVCEGSRDQCGRAEALACGDWVQSPAGRTLRSDTGSSETSGTPHGN